MSTVRINGHEIVRDIRSQMDDMSLLAKYLLTPRQLRRLYRELITMGLISEDDLQTRSDVSDSQITRAFVEGQKDVSEVT